MQVKNNKIILTEKQEHLLFVKYLRLHNILFHHSANEMRIQNKENVKWNMIRVNMGMSAGFPDFIIFMKGYLLCIEMKRLYGVPSALSIVQRDWIENLNKYDYILAGWCKGYDDAVNVIEYGKFENYKYNTKLICEVMNEK